MQELGESRETKRASHQGVEESLTIKKETGKKI